MLNNLTYNSWKCLENDTLRWSETNAKEDSSKGENQKKYEVKMRSMIELYGFHNGNYPY